MPTYLSPGVYVEEVPSGSASIAGVGTSTAGFVGIISFSSNPFKVGDEKQVGEASASKRVDIATGKTGDQTFPLPIPPELQGFKVEVTESAFYRGNSKDNGATVSSEDGKTQVVLSTPLTEDTAIKGYFKLRVLEVPTSTHHTHCFQSASNSASYLVLRNPVKGEKIGTGKNAVAVQEDGKTKYRLSLSQYPVLEESGQYQISSGTGTLRNLDTERQSVVEFDTKPADDTVITVDYYPVFQSVDPLDVQLCTNFSEFRQFFGDFSDEVTQNYLAHAVNGFFNNGGTRCYVTWISDSASLDQALQKFAAIDEIAIVAVPGQTDKALLNQVNTHCQLMGDRVAILDSPEVVEDSRNKLDLTKFDPAGSPVQPGKSDYAAYYFPWIQVFDPASKGSIYVPPSGHLAGIYARVDTQRGVHKAPANETVLGAVGLKYEISKAKQDGLNPQGINCIRALNGNIQVWGARTLGGNANGEFKYISTRRLFNYLRESLDEGLQWTVFEPNSPELWAKIRRNVTAFLTTVWRTGALFGTTPEQAFFVKCDEETNPSELREQGQVVTVIGVAVVKPAEFVIFRISQWAGPGGS